MMHLNSFDRFAEARPQVSSHVWIPMTAHTRPLNWLCPQHEIVQQQYVWFHPLTEALQSLVVSCMP